MSSLRSHWNEMPAARLLPALIGGILLFEISSHGKLAIAGVILLLGAAAFLIAMSFSRNIGLIYRLRFVAGSAVCIAVLSIGFILAFLQNQFSSARHFQHFVANENVCCLKISDEPAEKGTHLIFPAEVQFLQNDKTWHSVIGKVLLRVEKDSASMALQFGDELLVKASFREIEGPRNPGEFSYRDYQRRHRIGHRASLRRGNWRLLKANEQNDLMSTVHRARRLFLRILKAHVPTQNELGVASAMLLGYREFMNAEVLQAYSGSGALHVLSVSGLHVGIVFLTLQMLLGWLDKRRHGRILKATLIIVLMWCYACLTGLCPSVLRAVMMFSMASVAKARNRHTNGYNVLAASCLLLLLQEPMLIFEVGFLLSYLAVFGIMWLHPLLYKRLLIRQYILDKAWSLTCVSIAAQIATAPLSIFYFHQFPNYFLMSNLLVIPASDVLLMLGMALFVLHWLPYAGTLCGWLFFQCAYWMDKLIFLMNHLPYSLTENLQIAAVECVLLYLIVLVFVFWLMKRSGRSLWVGMMLLLLLCTSFSYRSYRHSQNTLFCVYSVPKRSAVAFIQGRTAYIFFDSVMTADEGSRNFHLHPHWQQLGVSKVLDGRKQLPEGCFYRTTPFGKIGFLNGKTVVWVERSLPYLACISRMPADVVIISGPVHADLELLKSWFDTNRIILDTSVPKREVEKWKAQAAAQQTDLVDAAAYATVVDWRR